MTKEQFIEAYMEKHMKKHEKLPYGMQWLSAIAETETKAEKAWNQRQKPLKK